MEAVLENPFILLCDHRINRPKDIIPLLEQVAKTGKPLLFIAEDIDSDYDREKLGARMLEGELGFDAARKEYVDLFGAGIIDPIKVVRIALENAVPVASVLLLAEATMTDIPEPEPEHRQLPELEA